MRKIREIFYRDKVAGQFGLEVEVEGDGLLFLEYSDKCPWKTVRDGSLRGEYPHHSCEYVLHRPIPYGKVSSALQVLKRCLDSADNVNFSFRTSIHVHYNVQEFTPVQVMNLIYTYTLIEGAMMNFCGKGRLNNRFCLRVRDAEGIIPILQEAFSSELGSFKELNEELARYSALNVCAIKKYGSIEFRGMEGTSDIKRLMTWITAIANLGEFAKEQKSPSTIYNKYVNYDDKTDFLKEVLRDVWEEFNFPDFNMETALSFSLSLDLPFTYAATCKVVPKEDVVEKNGIADLLAEPPVIPRVRRQAHVVINPIQRQEFAEQIAQRPFGDWIRDQNAQREAEAERAVEVEREFLNVIHMDEEEN